MTRMTPRSTHGWFSDVITIGSLKQSVDQGVDSTDLTYKTLVDLIVARQIRQDSSHTCDDIDVGRVQKLNQLHQQSLHTLLQCNASQLSTMLLVSHLSTKLLLQKHFQICNVCTVLYFT